MASSIRAIPPKIRPKTWIKEDLTDYLTKVIDNAYQLDPKPTRTFLYFSGEADSEGNWMCADGVVEIEWILG